MEKKQQSSFNIPGTKHNFNNAQLLISSGIPSFDNLIGEGIPVGTVTLIEEDVQGIYSRIILKYFLAEGIVNNHSILVASQDVNPQNIINQLPALIRSDPEPDNKPQGDDKMQIAFRYKNLPTSEKQIQHVFGHYYDLTKVMPLEEINQTDVNYWSGLTLKTTSNVFKNPAYSDLLETIKGQLERGKFMLKDMSRKQSILRIGIHGLGSPIWFSGESTVSERDSRHDLNKFLFCLRALLRSAFAIAVVTIPTYLYEEHSFERCIHASDIAVKLQSFAGTELANNKYLSEYHGYFHLTKLAAINSFISKHPGSVEYMFKLRRKKFCIEKLHLPPDITVSTDDEKPRVLSLGCGSSDKHLLEF